MIVLDEQLLGRDIIRGGSLAGKYRPEGKIGNS